MEDGWTNPSITPRLSLPIATSPHITRRTGAVCLFLEFTCSGQPYNSDASQRRQTPTHVRKLEATAGRAAKMSTPAHPFVWGFQTVCASLPYFITLAVLTVLRTAHWLS